LHKVANRRGTRAIRPPHFNAFRQSYPQTPTGRDLDANLEIIV
jgi:hypothetical protein